ncbi:unnamed protein product [Triticum turgidum subsp. durum]|uniref:Uncharacterized protein n=1 Tax=Triticum turgidum subsp. durum TaxID=4567 RepID=A0A9R1RPM7_TRITD|nr:unnamed protein product [Triticum turgidum subsp. durum]
MNAKMFRDVSHASFVTISNVVADFDLWQQYLSLRLTLDIFRWKSSTPMVIEENCDSLVPVCRWNSSRPRNFDVSASEELNHRV